MKTAKGFIVGLSVMLFLASAAGFGQVICESDLGFPRKGHTATWLPEPYFRVLIAGGETVPGVLQQWAELHALCGGFSVPAQMISPRAYHTAVFFLGFGGGVLISGGKDSRGADMNSAEIFHPNSSIFSSCSSMNRARSGHTATAVADGKILIVGGDADGTVELFDPASRVFSLLILRLNTPRRLHSAIRLNSGEVLIVGGTDMGGSPLLSAEIIDPSVPLPMPTFNGMSEARIRPDLRLLPDGKVQVLGGNEHKTFEMYDPNWRVFKAKVPVLAGGGHPVEIVRSNTRAALFHNYQTPIGQPYDALLDRSEHFLAESGHYRAAFVSGGVDSLGQALRSAFWLQSPPISVTTDVTDYVLGETAVISGQGWVPGEQVYLTMYGVASGERFETSAFADAAGNFSNINFLTGASTSSFLLTARSSRTPYIAQTSFQVSPSGLFVEMQPTGPTFPGGTANFQVNISIWPHFDQSFDAALTVLPPPEGPPLPPGTQFSFNPDTVHLDPNAPIAVATLTVTTSASTPQGDYPFAIRAFRIDDPGLHAAGTGLLILQPEFPPPVIVWPPESATRTVGESVTFSVVVDAQEPLSFQWWELARGPIPGATADSYTIPFVTAGDAGQYFVEVSNTGGSVSSALASLTVNRAVPDIVWNFPPVIRSGIPLDGAVLNAEAWFMGNPVEGEFVYDPGVGTVFRPGLITIEAVFAPLDSANYESCAARATIIAHAVRPDIVWSRPSDISYGTPLGRTQLNATAVYTGESVTGTFVYEPPEGRVLNAGADQMLMVNFTPDNPDIYTPTSASTLITVNKVKPTITWVNPPDVVYGTPLDGTQLNATASVDGTFVYEPGVGTVLLPGSRQLIATFTPADTTNYLGAAAQVMINVIQAPVAITWNNPADLSYGTALDGGQLNATADVPGSFSYTPMPGTILNAGSGQVLHVDFTPDDPVMYAGASMDVAINVLRAPLTVKADNKSKSYGAALPGFTASYTGFVAGQGPGDLGGSLVFSIPADAASPVGAYPITPSGQTSANYDIGYMNGILSISPLPLTVKAENTLKLLAAPLPAFSVTFDGFVLGEGPGVLGGILAFQTAATPASPVGSYVVTPFGLTSNNYEIIWLDGILSVVYAGPGACAEGHAILPPIKADGTSVFKKGSTVPAKFRVFDANCNSIGTPGVVSSFRLVQVIYGTAATPADEEVYSTTPDSAFRWSPEEELWVFNISTKNLTADQTYVYRITLNDGSVIEFVLGLK